MEKYEVSFRVAAPGWSADMRLGRVVITDGYTTVEDIPKILAISRGVKPEQIEVIGKLRL